MREKAEALLQKEQEILQLKKGEESAPGRALPPVPALWRPIREQNSPDSPCPPASPLPGPGHDAALLHTHQLQAELEALRSRRAEESEAAAVREGLLRLPGRGQGLALSDGEPRVSAIGRVPWGSRVLRARGGRRAGCHTLPGGGGSGRTQERGVGHIASLCCGFLSLKREGALTD